jgi:penicillin-insensitive murein endopeptidase
MAKIPIQPKDSRGYYMLPQFPEDAGYYVYGTPGVGAGQFGHPALLSLLFFVEREWQAIDRRKFGIGNISLADGGTYKGHGSHKNGLQVDIRPLRLDGAQAGVTIFQPELYDKKATARLIAIFRAHPSVRQVLFNDDIPGVTSWVGHHDHFHVAVKAATT